MSLRDPRLLAMDQRRKTYHNHHLNAPAVCFPCPDGGYTGTGRSMPEFDQSLHHAHLPILRRHQPA
eukprot:8481700-Heterocapsa_arctica.AAC.1